MTELKFAPRDIFEKILEYAVIPTFDLVIELPRGGVVVVFRKIKPYADTWALPGLRMMKPESIEDTLTRIARQEVGLEIDTKERVFLGQFVGRFRTEMNRQDLSTGYFVRAMDNDIKINTDHFSRCKVIFHRADIPKRMGAMYKYYLHTYFDLKEGGKL